jgi:DNA-binding NarL/FixJ family response regulator
MPMTIPIAIADRQGMFREALQQLPVRPILLTDEVRTSEITRAMLQGARGVVRKDAEIVILFI